MDRNRGLASKHYMRLRLFSTLKSAVLPLNSSKNKLKIYSSLGGGNNPGFRLTNGVKVCESIVIIGANYYKINKSETPPKEAVKLLLRTIRPVPEIVVIGQKNPEKWDDLKAEFGCSVEVSESLTAASTFNTLIDDDRGVIGIFL